MFILNYITAAEGTLDTWLREGVIILEMIDPTG